MNPALELVNSEWWRGRPGGVIDKLADDAWLAEYTTRTGLGTLGPPSASERKELHELRTVLRNSVETHGAGIALLDRYLSRGAVRRRVDDGKIVLEPLERDWRWAMSEIASSFVELLADGDASRLKVCANNECQWSFYDESKNHSRRWCGAATCGTADKVRRFRERQRRARTAG